MISIIVVTYNNENFTKSFFISLRKSLTIPYELILFDNNSQDHIVKKAEGISKKIKIKTRLIKNSKNIGFAGAVNQAVALCKSKDILLINPDTILNKHSISKLYRFYRKSGGIVGGRMDDHRSAVASVKFLDCILELTNLKKIKFLQSYNNFWIKNASRTQHVSSVSGGYMMFSKKIFNELGGFDRDYWLYLEDVDFCMRARRKGYSIMYYPASKIKHFGGGSSKGNKNKINPKEWFKSRDVLFKKNFNSFHYLVYFIVSRMELAILKLLNKL